MGMDAYLYSAHSKKELQSDNYWNRVEDEENKWTLGRELVYWRKFYALQNFISSSLPEPYECGEYIEVDKEMLKEIIIFCCFHRDYWDEFKSVSALCEVYDHYDELEDAGLKLFYECDW